MSYTESEVLCDGCHDYLRTSSKILCEDCYNEQERRIDRLEEIVAELEDDLKRALEKIEHLQKRVTE